MATDYVKKINGKSIAASEVAPSSSLETKINGKADKSSTVSNVAWNSTNKKLTKTINGSTSDVVTATTLKSAMSLNNVTNDAQVKRTEMGTANGVATLDANGVINTSQLPSYVDDVLEYSAKSQFPATGETGKIYVDTSTNLTWRWSGTTYVEISPSLALGETSSTAYRGDRGKTAYDHSQLTSGNPHHVTAEDVKAVRYDTNAQGLTDTQKSNARINIGAGTSSLTIGTTATTAAAGNHAHGNIDNGGTLTDTAAAAAGNDYVVIRDADNAKIQTSTIKGTDVADAVSKKHSHSTLTLSTTAQAYDGTHTLALPSSDPYTSARTPASHSHGNIQNNGSIVGGSDGTGKSIASGDRLIVAEPSNTGGYKAILSTTSFDGSTTSKALTPKGTFETFQGDVKYQLVEYGALQYSNITTILNAGRVPVVYSDNSLYVCDGTAYTVNGVNEYRFTKASGNVDSPRIIYIRLRDDSTGWGGGVIALASNSALSTKADASVVSTLSSNVAAHSTLFHSEVLDVTDNSARFLKISFSGRVGRCIALIIISDGATSTAFRLSWEYINSTSGIAGIGKEIFTSSDLSKPPLVYKDSDNFYIGVYTSQNRGATISLMMTSEDPSKVSFSTVTRAVSTASDKTAVPLTWHAVMSETVNEIVVGYVGTSSKTLYIV